MRGLQKRRQIVRDSHVREGVEAQSVCRATRGIGQTQPVNWQDAGLALDNEELKGVMMPSGAAQDVNPAGAYLQYNEVRNYFEVYIGIH